MLAPLDEIDHGTVVVVIPQREENVMTIAIALDNDLVGATPLLVAPGKGANMAAPPFVNSSPAFPSQSIMLERSSQSRVRYAAPNNGAPLTAPGRSEEPILI